MRCEHADTSRRAPYVTGVRTYYAKDTYICGRHGVRMDKPKLAKQRGAVYARKNPVKYTRKIWMYEKKVVHLQSEICFESII